MNNSNIVWKLPKNFKVPFKVFDTLEYDKEKIRKRIHLFNFYIPIIIFIFFLKNKYKIHKIPRVLWSSKF